MDYGYVRKVDIKLNFVNGSAETELLEGALPFIRSYRGVLQKGHSITPEVRSRVLSTYIITAGKGMIITETRAYNIEELSFFFASLEEPFTMKAVTDLEYTKFDLTLSDYDMKKYDESHLVLPLFRKESDCLVYTQNVKKSNDTLQRTVVQGHQMIRVVVGSNHAGENSGFFEIGHNAVAQYNICHSQCDFTMEVDGHRFPQKAGDVCYIKAGLPHGSIVGPGQRLDYVYYEVYVQPENFLISYPEGPFAPEEK